MDTKQPKICRAIEGSILDAYPHWRNTGVRVANHVADIDGEHYEWLSFVRPDGSLRIWQHYPQERIVCTITSGQISRLLAPKRGGFSSGAIRAHFRNEARRRR